MYCAVQYDITVPSLPFRIFGTGGRWGVWQEQAHAGRTATANGRGSGAGALAFGRGLEPRRLQSKSDRTAISNRWHVSMRIEATGS